MTESFYPKLVRGQNYGQTIITLRVTGIRDEIPKNMDQIQAMREKNVQKTYDVYLPLPNLLRPKKINFNMSKRRQYK